MIFMDRDIRTYFLFIGLPAVLITAVGLAALLFGVSGIVSEIKVLDVERQHDRYEQRIKNRMVSRLKAYRETRVADYVWKMDSLPWGTNIPVRKYGVYVSTNGATIGWARLDDDTVIGCGMPPFAPENRAPFYLIVVGATIVALLFFILFTGGVLLARAAKRAREDLDVKNTFLDIVSHELNTPLGSIVPLSSALAHGRIKDDARRAEAIATISHESERMARMIAELLTVVRLRNGKLNFDSSRIELRDVVERAVSLVRVHHPDCVIQVVAGASVFALADADKAEQVVVNLIENACRYAGDDTVEVSCMRGVDGSACVAVADRGPGFSEEERKRIFERFYQTSPGEGSEGLGLGLNIVSGFVSGMGGTVEVRAREGGGSVFSVKLPLCEAETERGFGNG
jgi:signal transduction histidine kinase